MAIGNLAFRKNSRAGMGTPLLIVSRPIVPKKKLASTSKRINELIN